MNYCPFQPSESLSKSAFKASTKQGVWLVLELSNINGYNINSTDGVMEVS